MNKNKKSTKIALLENAKSDPFSSQLREKTLRLYMHYTPKEVVFRATDNLGNTLNSIVANWIDHYTVSLQKAIVLKIRGAKMRGEPLGTLFIPQHTSLGQESTFETSDDYLIDMERDLLEFTLVKLLSFEKDIESYIINILSQYRVVEFCKSSVFSR